MAGAALTAQDVMTTAVVSVTPGVPVTALARLLAERGISSVPVTNAGGRLLGLVTEADLLRRLAGTEDRPTSWLRAMFSNADREAQHYARTHGVEAQDVMTRDVITVTPEASCAHCAHLMELHRIKRLPVVREGRLVGIVSRTDLLRALLEPEARIGSAAHERDAGIRTALRAEMRNHPWANSLALFTDVQDGVVTLHGFVRSDAVRRGLRVLALRIEGVERVEDRLEKMPMPLPASVI